MYCLYNVSKKEVKDEVEFLDPDKHQSFLWVDFSTLGIKVFYKIIDMIMKMWRACWWAWSIILQLFKVLKVTSFWCLYNFTISKKKLWMEFILEFIKIKTSTIWVIAFWWKPGMSQVPKKRSLLNFCNIPGVPKNFTCI